MISMLKHCEKQLFAPPLFLGVDVIPASIDDGFVASQWESLVAEHLPDLNLLKSSGKQLLTVSLVTMILSS